MKRSFKDRSKGKSNSRFLRYDKADRRYLALHIVEEAFAAEIAHDAHEGLLLGFGGA